MKKFDVDYFIDKFQAIPKENWRTGDYFLHPIGGAEQCCALGHCGERYSGNGLVNSTDESRALSKLFIKHGMEVVSVNDGGEYKFKIITGMDQPNNPKDRILQFLEWIKIN